MHIPVSLRSLSILALVEGVSLVALLGIAMPLKGAGGFPRLVGSLRRPVVARHAGARHQGSRPGMRL